MTRPLAPDERLACSTCGGSGAVSVAWPSGYPHAAPCPTCNPDAPCCDVLGCPTPAAFRAWREAGAATPTRTSRINLPALDITCDHKGGPGAVDEDGEFNEYHCPACCPGACIGASGDQGPCSMHKEGAAAALLETGEPQPRALAMVMWFCPIDGKPMKVIGFRGVHVDIDTAELLALDILRAVGAARRGDQ